MLIKGIEAVSSHIYTCANTLTHHTHVSLMDIFRPSGALGSQCFSWGMTSRTLSLILLMAFYFYPTVGCRNRDRRKAEKERVMTCNTSPPPNSNQGYCCFSVLSLPQGPTGTSHICFYLYNKHTKQFRQQQVGCNEPRVWHLKEYCTDLVSL